MGAIMLLPLTNKETLAILKDAFIKALALYEESKSDESLISLRKAENAYMLFVETHDL